MAVVWLKNLQTIVKLNESLLMTQAQFLLATAVRGTVGRGREVPRFGMSLVCVPSDEIQDINRRYRKLDEPTDVLSFPYHEVVVTHGICHLLGYTHDTPTKHQQMYSREKATLTCYNNSFGTNIIPLSN
ncbi:PREDICTED: putative ribonuclease isoform X2 [Amphimedon queenslandica]|uniref:Uncharacterized protein n=1 Tax=Amphimedon queenslandica TaxID=400682 RepID=A0AAN0IV72_AMPQE|nr:PREDICTED: putative ribonuclease isoform X2 [Amphimedon queenslandica]|eukprot:XP_011409816.1 PREDICTED: putative ribonuclease isoform X2 [Amphimedon queenslandica]